MKAIGKKPVVLASDPSSSPNKALDGSSYRKGMFLAFIDDALAQRYKVGGHRMFHLTVHSAAS